MPDSLTALADSLRAVSPTQPADSVREVVEGVVRSQALAYSSWIAANLFILTAVMFVMIYKDRQYLLYRLRDYFSKEERFFFSRPQTVANKSYVIGILLLVTCSSVGLIVAGLANLHPSLFGLDASSSVYDTEGLVLSMQVLGGTLLFVLFKAFLYLMINWVFFRPDQNMRWISSFFFITAAFSFLLYPFSMIELFVSVDGWILTFCLSFLFIVYEISIFYKLIINFKAKNYGILLIFLYFCAVELLPALFIWQKIQNRT